MQDHSAQLRLLRRLTIAGVGLREAIVLIACDGRKSSEIADATKQDWTGFKVDAVDADENQCVSHLFSSLIRVDKQYGSEQITIDEAVQAIKKGYLADAEMLALLRIGIKIEGETLAIANNHQGLERCFTNTPWAGAKWKGQLLRVSGAFASAKPIRFGQNVVQRAVFLPL
jgi:hypothetical protein